MRRIGKLPLVVAAQVVVFLAWACYHEHLRQTAPTFRLPLNPADPYDLFRGRYFILNPIDSRVERPRPLEDRDPLFDAFLAALDGQASFQGELIVGFCRESSSTGEVERVCTVRRPGSAKSADEPAHEIPARVRLWLRPRSRGDDHHGPPQPIPETVEARIDLELDRFFIPNRAELPGATTGSGWEVEVIHRPGRCLLAKRLWYQGKPVEL